MKTNEFIVRSGFFPLIFTLHSWLGCKIIEDLTSSLLAVLKEWFPCSHEINDRNWDTEVLEHNVFASFSFFTIIGTKAVNPFTMRFLCIFAMLMVAPYCIAAPASASIFDFLTSARLNLGVNAGVRLPQLPTLTVEDREIPVPLPDLATVEIPLFYPQINIVGRELQASKSYH